MVSGRADIERVLRQADWWGLVDRTACEQVLTRLGLSADDAGALIAFRGNDDQIDMVHFMEWLFGADNTGAPVGSDQNLCCVSCWNIRSPELSGNLFEMYPGKGTIVDEAQNRLLIELSMQADEMLMSLETSERLDDILPGDLPLLVLDDPTKAGGMEKAPLDASNTDGLRDFFRSRLDPGMTAEQLQAFLDRWLQEPEARWEYWKEQKACDFIADDGSGGKSKTNKLLANAPLPLIDMVAWSLSLGVADMKNQASGTRWARVQWLYPDGSVAEDFKSLKVAPELGEFDFFKLMVWDLLLAAVRDRARSKWVEGIGHWDATFKGLKGSLSHTSSLAEHMNKVVSIIVNSPRQADIIVLIEVSGEVAKDSAPPFVTEIETRGGLRYVALKPPTLDSTSNVVILARADHFIKWEIQPFVGGNGVMSRALGVVLTDTTGACMQVIGLHLPGNGHNIPQVCSEVERRLGLGLPTILAGDLNLDLRVPKAQSKFTGDQPLLQSLVDANRHLWDQPLDRGSVNKRRTAFQAQTSKINLEDFSIKDAILVSSQDLGTLDGLITRSETLPSKDCPSDHVLLSWHSPSWPGPLPVPA